MEEECNVKRKVIEKHEKKQTMMVKQNCFCFNYRYMALLPALTIWIWDNIHEKI